MNHSMKEDISLLKRRILAGIPCIFAAAAFCCSYVGSFYCDNVQFVPSGDFEQTDFYRPRPLSFGLWMYKQQRMTNVVNGEIVFSEFCTGYDTNSSIHIDSNWKIARIFSCIGIVLSGFLLLWQFCAPFLLFDTNYWRIAMILFTFLAVFQALTLFFLRSDACVDNTLIYTMAYNPKLYPDQCTWDSGTHTSIASLVLYIITVLSMCCIPAPGTRPNLRPYPMMVWDEATNNRSDDDIDDDDDSVLSFACDDDCDDLPVEKNKSRNAKLEDDRTETDLSYSSHDDDDIQFVKGGIEV
jgi:hypothetical protein